MESSAATSPGVATSWKRVARRLLCMGENRLELLLLEIEEERDRVLLAILLSLGIAVFGLLAGISVTALIVLLMWERSPLGALTVVTVLHLAIGGFLYGRLMHLKKNWEMFPETADQLRKDRECLQETLE